MWGVWTNSVFEGKGVSTSRVSPPGSTLNIIWSRAGCFKARAFPPPVLPHQARSQYRGCGRWLASMPFKALLAALLLSSVAGQNMGSGETRLGSAQYPLWQTYVTCQGATDGQDYQSFSACEALCNADSGGANPCRGIEYGRYVSGGDTTGTTGSQTRYDTQQNPRKTLA